MFKTKVAIHIHSQRHRLCDPDGISAKAAIDALVKYGMLKDDSAKYIEKVSYSQELVPNNQKEQTKITITEVL